MTFAVTKVSAYGVEASEYTQAHFPFRQCWVIEGTAANTNVAYDFGNYTGTFWTAVGGTEPGTTALNALKDIQVAAKAYIAWGGIGLDAYTRAVASVTSVGALTSAVYAGGSATPTLTVTGLLTTDTILGATQIAANGNSLPLIGAAATCAVNDQYAVVYSADPGGSGTVRVLYSRALTAVPSGSYQMTMNGTNTNLPEFLFLSGNAPTAFKIQLEWLLKEGMKPIEAQASA